MKKWPHLWEIRKSTEICFPTRFLQYFYSIYKKEKKKKKNYLSVYLLSFIACWGADKPCDFFVHCLLRSSEINSVCLTPGYKFLTAEKRAGCLLSLQQGLAQCFTQGLPEDLWELNVQKHSAPRPPPQDFQPSFWFKKKKSCLTIYGFLLWPTANPFCRKAGNKWINKQINE